MDEPEDNMSSEDIKYEPGPSFSKTKPKKRSLVERELETNLTERVTSPVTNASSTSRYGRARKRINETDSSDLPKSPKTEILNAAQSPVYKMHASNSPIRTETPKRPEPVVENQIDTIYNENISLGHFGSEEKKKSARKYPKVYIRKDLIQSREKDDDTIVLIKNMFSPNSAKKSKTSSSEKYVPQQSMNGYNTSVVKTLDFDENKKKKEKKTVLSKNDLFEMEAKCEYQVGDLAWARMGTYPFWPCIITRDPLSGIYLKKKLFGRIERDVLHVTFFGDNGRRGWIVDSMLRKFHGQLEFEAAKNNFTPETKKKDQRLYSAYFVSEKKLAQWQISVDEAETLLREPKRFRIDILNDMLEKNRTLKPTPKNEKSKKITRTNSDVSLSESLYDTLFSEDDSKVNDSERPRSKSKNRSLDVSEVVTACLDNMAAKSGITKIQKQSHMDRWLQKAKTKTPEKSHLKSQIKDDKNGQSKKKLPKEQKKPYNFRSSEESVYNDNKLKPYQNEHDYSQKYYDRNSPMILDNVEIEYENAEIFTSDIIEPGSGLGIISKVETLCDVEHKDNEMILTVINDEICMDDANIKNEISVNDGSNAELSGQLSSTHVDSLIELENYNTEDNYIVCEIPYSGELVEENNLKTNETENQINISEIDSELDGVCAEKVKISKSFTENEYVSKIDDQKIEDNLVTNDSDSQENIICTNNNESSNKLDNVYEDNLEIRKSIKKVDYSQNNLDLPNNETNCAIKSILYESMSVANNEVPKIQNKKTGGIDTIFTVKGNSVSDVTLTEPLEEPVIKDITDIIGNNDRVIKNKNKVNESKCDVNYIKTITTYLLDNENRDLKEKIDDPKQHNDDKDVAEDKVLEKKENYEDSVKQKPETNYHTEKKYDEEDLRSEIINDAVNNDAEYNEENDGHKCETRNKQPIAIDSAELLENCFFELGPIERHAKIKKELKPTFQNKRESPNMRKFKLSLKKSSENLNKESNNESHKFNDIISSIDQSIVNDLMIINDYCEKNMEEIEKLTANCTKAVKEMEKEIAGTKTNVIETMKEQIAVIDIEIKKNIGRQNIMEKGFDKNYVAESIERPSVLTNGLNEPILQNGFHKANTDVEIIFKDHNKESLRHKHSYGKEKLFNKEEPEFLKYLELRQDALIDEQPELTQEEITNYLYKTWLYEECLKNDTKKADDIDNANLVKGLNQGKVQTKKIREKVKIEKIKEPTLRISEKAKRKVRKPFMEDFTYTDLNNRVRLTKIDCLADLTNGYHGCDSTRNNNNKNVELISSKIEIKAQDSTENNYDKNVEFISSKIEIKAHDSTENNYDKKVESMSSKIEIKAHDSTENNFDKKAESMSSKIEIKAQDSIQNNNAETIESMSGEVEIKAPEITKNKYDKKVESMSNKAEKKDQNETSIESHHGDSDKDPTTVSTNDVLLPELKSESNQNTDLVLNLEKPGTPSEIDQDNISIKSEDSEVSIDKKKRKDKFGKKTVLEDPEFLKYLELRQDALIDENPELTQEEITKYLYKTWLYEENLKNDTKKADDMDNANLVKGLNQEPQKKLVKKKINVEKEKKEGNLIKEVFKEKSKRKILRPYYREDFSDTEDDIEHFEIFKSTHRIGKTKSLEAVKVEDCHNEEGTELPIEFEEYETEEINEVEEFFGQLTAIKPNVFKGLMRERVCEICEKVGSLVKCKGCHCMFHVDCVKKPTPVVEVSIPNRGRKKKKKNRGRKPKEDMDSGSQSDEKSQDAIVSEEMNVSLENDEESHVIANVDDFEDNFESKMKELLEKSEKVDYDSCSNDENDWNDVNYGECKITDIKQRKKEDFSNFKCSNCQELNIPICFVCKLSISPKNKAEHRQKCLVAHCHKYYHMECLDHWPQTQFNGGVLSRTSKRNEYFEAFSCPRHVCHTCVCDDPRGCKTRFSGDKLARCVRCPATYHTFTKCLPAGTQILSGSHIICPRHYEHRPGKVPCHVNTAWCFICALGGTLICCEYCPTSFHAECLNIKPPEGGYMCEDCETGRLPLYGEMVWVKLGHYRWWPGIILHPSEIPLNILAVKHSPGEFVVRFFGQYDHYWVNRGRVFPFQEGDSGRVSVQKSKIDADFAAAMEDAQRACEILKTAVPNEEESIDIAQSLLPPHYVKLKVNKPIGSLCGRKVDLEESSLTQCECDPNDADPCGPYTQCLNRMLLTECGPTCRAGDRCNNRAFEKRLYPKMVPYRTPQRGWGLRTLEDIKAGQFVIEYVGELIDEEEFQRRMRRKHEVRDENFYFLTLDKERVIDAGPKGNLARFMNHSCEPNCETEKWTVLGDIRVGLFAIYDIPANSELTFNYNLESAGIEKKRCMCGAKRCSGYIGAKPKQDDQPKKTKRTYKKRKNVEESPSTSQKPKNRIGRPYKPRELTDIEKDLLIIKSASGSISSDSECSGRLSIDSTKDRSLKRKKIFTSQEETLPKKIKLEI